VRLIKERGVSYAQASHDLSVHQSQLRGWVKALADDPQQAFPGQGQMKPEQLEIAQLKHEVNKLKAERDILKKSRIRIGYWKRSSGINNCRNVRIIAASRRNHHKQEINDVRVLPTPDNARRRYPLTA
jgi:transposase